MSRPGAQVTRSSSGSGLGEDTGHWTELTGRQRSRGSRRQSRPSEQRLAMLGPGPWPLALTSAHHLPPPDPGLGLTFSDGAHCWRVSTSPRRPEVQQKAKVSASRTCRLLSSSLSLTPGRQGKKEKLLESHGSGNLAGLANHKSLPLGSIPNPRQNKPCLPSPVHFTILLSWSQALPPPILEQEPLGQGLPLIHLVSPSSGTQC